MQNLVRFINLCYDELSTMVRNSRVEELLDMLPDAPGVYLFYNRGKELIYVGKATSLRSRVRSYWSSSAKASAVAKALADGSADKHVGNRPIESLLHEVVDIDWVVTDSALEAIILEANEIKKYQPKYNVDGKDDKSWNYIAISKDAYPRIETIRQHELGKLGKKFFVIPTGVSAANAVEESGYGERLPDSSIPSRLSRDSSRNDKTFAHVFGPYPGLNTKAAMKVLRKLFSFSTCQKAGKRKNGRTEELKNLRPCLYYQMHRCLGVCMGEISPRDYRAKVILPLVTFLSGRKKQLLKQLEIRMRRSARAQDFEEAARLRNQIQNLQRIQDIALLNKSFVSSSIQKKVLPLVGGTEGGFTGGMSAVSTTINIRRIEGYDISNLGAIGKVGSMVVFVNGEADKNQYRKFKIKTVEGQSDVDCLEEVIRRRLRHAEWDYPQLFLIDGGKPQVNRVKKILDELHVDIPVVGIAKGPERKRNDIILGFRASDFGFLKSWVYANTRLLIAVRDEAHRFAIGYQRQTRKLVRHRA